MTGDGCALLILPLAPESSCSARACAPQAAIELAEEAHEARLAAVEREAGAGLIGQVRRRRGDRQSRWRDAVGTFDRKRLRSLAESRPMTGACADSQEELPCRGSEECPGKHHRSG